jgi:hypothetical protein
VTPVIAAANGANRLHYLEKSCGRGGIVVHEGFKGHVGYHPQKESNAGNHGLGNEKKGGEEGYHVLVWNNRANDKGFKILHLNFTLSD